jgi:glutathione-regulated potassium-efflux system ancillary protein KefG
MTKRSVLLLFAHPALEKSRVNRRLLDEVRSIDGVTVHDLYELYPDFDIDVAREQALLAKHDVIVMQHPFYWYSTPAILKEWQDLVLEHGWAYGGEGTALHGKSLMAATTAGGSEESYRPGGHNFYTIEQFLAPLERTAALCGMRWRRPFVVHGTHSLTETEIAQHASRYRRRIESLIESAEQDRG